MINPTDTSRPKTHVFAKAQLLAEHFQNTHLAWVDDSRTLIPIDQPKILTDRLYTFLAAHT